MQLCWHSTRLRDEQASYASENVAASKLPPLWYDPEMQSLLLLLSCPVAVARRRQSWSDVQHCPAMGSSSVGDARMEERRGSLTQKSSPTMLAPPRITMTGGNEGWVGAADGVADGWADGAAVGAADGEEEGAAKGADDGAAEGDRVGVVDGAPDGMADGVADGVPVGTADGAAEGVTVGVADGAADGSADGAADGVADGELDGAADGAAEGMTVGVADGAADG